MHFHIYIFFYFLFINLFVFYFVYLLETVLIGTAPISQQDESEMQYILFSLWISAPDIKPNEIVPSACLIREK